MAPLPDLSHHNFNTYIPLPKDTNDEWKGILNELIDNRPLFLFFVLGSTAQSDEFIGRATDMFANKPGANTIVVGLRQFDADVEAYLQDKLKMLDSSALSAGIFDGVLSFITTMDDRIAQTVRADNPNATTFAIINAAWTKAVANN